MFRDHIRLVIGSLVMALAVSVLFLSPVVQSSVKPVFVDAPTNLRVTAASSSAITINWDAAPGVGVYNIERSESMSGPFMNRGGIFGTSFTDTEVTPLHAYVYRVRGLGQGNVSSDPSKMAVGTAISFEFNQLVEQQNGQVIRHEIKARHLTDVRTAINALRAVANMPSTGWTRENLNGQLIQASDVQELRDRLNEVLTVLQIPLPLYDDPNLSTGANGTPIKATHIEQLQVGSTRGASNGTGPLYSNNLSRATVGEFGGIIDLPTVPVHLSVLPDGRILFWGRDYARDAQNNIITDQQTGKIKQAGGHSDTYVGTVGDQSISGVVKYSNTTTNLFCSGHSFLPDGNLFVTGGHRSAHFDAAGEDHINIFNYKNNSWTSGPHMVHGRWYPYNVTLATGEALVMSGSYWSNEPVPPYNPYDPYASVPTNVSITTNFVSQIYMPVSDVGLKDLAEPPADPSPNEPPVPRLTVYPYVHLTPDGRVFQAQSGFFVNPSTNAGAVEKQSRLLDTKKNEWTQLDNTRLPHDRGSSVLFDRDNVLLVGGFDNGGTPTNGTEFFNLTQLGWTEVTPMKFQRAYHTATILPNGKVLVTGGVSCQGRNNIESFDAFGMLMCSDGRVMTPELWDPIMKKWTTMAPQHELRAYHSVAALLPDGRVLVGGGGFPGAVGEFGITSKITDTEIRDLKLNAFASGHANFEIYSPPYLFNANGTLAPRPAITSTPPEVVSNGDTFFIGTSGTGIGSRVSLIRLPSVTHGFDQDQRQISIIPALTSGGLNVTVPASPNICPPGYYMLFVLNAADVPSVAKIIRVQNTSIFPVDVPVTTASAAGLTWEQGVEFSSLIDGQITHIRFWKAPGETGAHVGHIWDAVTGAELASAQFFNESASGWQEAQLSTPLSINANRRYKVTFNVNTLGAKTFDVFTDWHPGGPYRPILSWPLVGWGSSYSTPAGTFPTTGSTSNLFADVRFK